jgi:branched-chain amino acid aminotransferase
VLRERVDETLAANELADAYVKLSVTRGVQPGKLTPNPAVDPTIVVYVSPLGRGGTGGQRVWEEPATLSTVSQRKPPASALPADAKTHNYLDSILARLELRGTDSDEAVVLSVDGLLTEGATSNLFFCRDGVLCTPAESVPLLPGITRDVVLDIADEQEIPIETGEYGPECLDEATEAFVTNSTWEIRPVTAIDDRAYNVGPKTRELQRAFDERIEQCYE